jgi:hypothetical protein
MYPFPTTLTQLCAVYSGYKTFSMPGATDADRICGPNHETSHDLPAC